MESFRMEKTPLRSLTPTATPALPSAPLNTSPSATSTHQLVLHVPCDGTQDELLHGLPGTGVRLSRVALQHTTE